jgi:hypothetical protein
MGTTGTVVGIKAAGGVIAVGATGVGITGTAGATGATGALCNGILGTAGVFSCGKKSANKLDVVLFAAGAGVGAGATAGVYTGAGIGAGVYTGAGVGAVATIGCLDNIPPSCVNLGAAISYFLISIILLAPLIPKLELIAMNNKY